MDRNQSYSLVILAAGLGRRFGGNKQIAEIDGLGCTIMELSIADAKKAGIRHLVLVVNEKVKPYVEQVILPRISDEIRVDLAIQSLDQVPPHFRDTVKARTKPYGTGHALLAAKPYLKSKFVVITADDYYGESAFEQVLKCAKQHQSWAMLGYRLGDTLSQSGGVNRGICVVNQAHQLVEIQEHLNIKEIDSQILNQQCDELSAESLVSMTIWALDTLIFEQLENGFIKFLQDDDSVVSGEFYLPDQIQHLIDNTQITVHVVPAKDLWLGVTYQHEFNVIAEQLTQLVSQKPASVQ